MRKLGGLGTFLGRGLDSPSTLTPKEGRGVSRWDVNKLRKRRRLKPQSHITE